MFLKAALHVIAAPISRLFDPSLLLSAFPSDWKSAMVFKGGSGSDPNCYRPISILPFLSKVLEKVVLKQLNHFLDANQILSDLQSGFRAARGCLTATMKILEDIITYLDCKQSWIAAFIDLAKAFDSSIGLSSACCDWFARYLTNRVQHVKVENILSDPLTISKVTTHISDCQMSFLLMQEPT